MLVWCCGDSLSFVLVVVVDGCLRLLSCCLFCCTVKEAAECMRGASSKFVVSVCVCVDVVWSF